VKNRASEPTFDVVGVGHAIVDVVARVDDAFLAEWKLDKGSMALIDTDRAQRLYAAMPPAIEISGGSAANTTVGVASLGGSAAFIGRVSDDELGRVFAHDIRAAGVEFASAPAEGGTPTGRSLILVTPDAERTMNTYLGIGAEFRTSDVDPELIQQGRIVYVEGYLWDDVEAKAAIRHSMECAHQAGRLVALSLSDPFCVDRWRDEFVSLIDDCVDVLFGNADELRSMYQVDDIDKAIAIAKSHCQIVAATRGPAGSTVVSATESVTVPAPPVPHVVDTTGAGDLYAAGVLAGLARNLPLDVCAQLGHLAAGEVISHLGARPEVELGNDAKSILAASARA